MSLRPLGDRVVVKRNEAEEMSPGGIVIPDAAKEKPVRGEVLAAGPGTVGAGGCRVPLDVKQGDTVLFGRYAGTEIEVDGETCLVMRVEDVLAVVE